MNNQLHWKEWFSMSYKRLALKLNIQTEITVKNAINSLKQKGYIKIHPGKGATPNKYSIVKLYQSKNDGQLIQNQAENNLKPLPIIKQNENKQHQTDSGALSSSFKFSECVRFFDDNFHAITPVEFERLGSLAEDYGQKRVLRALNIAVEQNKRSLAYVRGILERWEREGFPAADERGKSAPVEKPKTPLPLPPFAADPVQDPLRRD